MRASCSSGSLRFKSHVLLVLLALTSDRPACARSTKTLLGADCSAALQASDATAAVVDHAIQAEILGIVVVLGYSEPI